MTTMTFKPFVPHEQVYADMTALHNRYWPRSPRTVEQIKQEDSQWEAALYRERILLYDGDHRMLGFGSVFQAPWSDIPNKLFIEATIDPDLNGTDIEATFFARLMERARHREAISVVSGTYQDRTDRIALIQRYGFEWEATFAKSEQDVTAFPMEQFAPVIERVQQQGITFATEVDLRQRHDDYVKRAWELAWDVEQDMPSPDPPRQTPLEVFQTWLDTDLRRLPEAAFFALDGDRYIGLTTLETLGDDGSVLGVGITGIRRTYRRRGVATALKVMATAFAREYGATSIRTTNEENNPMFGLNIKLGFKPTPAWVSFVKPFT
ncbi:MAG: GNAT family N-acetyltransferase [Myxococcota bacterium]